MRAPRRRGLFLPDTVQRELDEELAFHFESVVGELMRQGMTEEAAWEEARHRFGDERRYRRAVERMDQRLRRRRRMADRWVAWGTNMRYAWRTLRRTPGPSFGVVLAFALGIGANATMYGIIDRLLLSPPAHITDPDRVHRLVIDRYLSFRRERVQSVTMTWSDYEDFRNVTQFAGVAGYANRRVMLGRGEDAVNANAMFVTGSFFDVLGVRPVLGRFFGEEEDRRGAPRVVVIGHALWRSRFGGSSSVIGRRIDFGDGEYTIIGVAPRGFTGVGLERVDIWAPMQTAGAALIGEEWLTPARTHYFLRVVARVAPGVSLSVAEQAATAVHRAGRAESIRERDYDAEVRVVAAPLIAARARPPSLTGSRVQEAMVALWLAGVSGVVLLIACVNVANLLVAQSLRRKQEIGIRLAIGITRERLMGQTLLEGCMLAGLGGLAALVVTRWGGDLVRTILLPDVEFVTATLLWRTVPVVIGLAILAGLMAAVVPALDVARRDPADALRSASGGITRSALRVRGVLTVVQAALSVTLLAGAGLFVRSLHNVRSLDLGFDMEDVLVAMLVEDGGGLSDAELRAFYDAALERVRSLPGVQSAAYSVSMPFNWSWAYDLTIPGRDSLPVPRAGGPYVNPVSRDYLETLDLRVLRGRGFEDADFGATPLVTLVNEAMAELYWPGEDPLGACLQINTYSRVRPTLPCTTVVGVVENARRGSVIEEPNPQYYVPYVHPAVQNPPIALFIEAPRATAGTMAEIRRALMAVEPRLRYVRVQPLEDWTANELRSWRLGATMFTIFGLLALVMAALGLYSVLAFDIAQRRREIGLRSALGAGRERIMATVVGRALRMTVAGIVIGLTAAVLLAPRLQSLLYATAPRDPVTLAAAGVVLVFVALLASGLPAWRAARVDPNIALRSD